MFVEPVTSMLLETPGEVIGDGPQPRPGEVIGDGAAAKTWRSNRGRGRRGSRPYYRRAPETRFDNSRMPYLEESFSYHTFSGYI